MKMDEIYDLRHQRFMLLLAEEYDGKQSALAAAIGKPANYVSRIKGRTKKIGEDMAREIEEAIGKPAYWLDARHESDSWPFSAVERSRYESLTPDQRRGIEQWVGRQVEAFSQDATPKSTDEKAA